MSLFSDGIATMLGSIRQIKGESVIYRRGDIVIVLRLAVPLGGDRPRDVDGSYTLAFDELDWGLDRNELIHDGTELQPAEYDTIERTLKGRVLTYKIFPDEKKECWRWSDDGQSQYRVKTKLDSNVPA